MVIGKSRVKVILILTLFFIVVMGAMFGVTSKAGVQRTEECDLETEHEISVLSQNLRVTAVLDDGWDNFVVNRYSRVDKICKRYDADIKCFQEADLGWRTQLDAICDLSEYHKICSKNSKGLANPIYVKKAKFSVLKSGSFVVSDSYNREAVVDGVKEMKSYEDRIATWVMVREKQTGKTFTMVNTHLSFHADVQKQSCEKILKFVKSCGSDGYLICGDFNFSMHNTELYNVMTGEGTKDLAIAVGTEGKRGIMTYTYHGYGKAGAKKRIDFFFGSDSLTCKMYTVVNDMIGGKYASDHYGILTNIDINTY